MPKLLVRFRDGSVRTVEITPRPLTVGRAESCDIVLAHDGQVSREHAHIWLDETGRVLVADRASKNGTRVDDGEPFHNDVRAAVRSIRVGEYDLKVVGVQPTGTLEQPSVRFAPEQPVPGDNTRFFPSSRRPEVNQQRLGLLISLTERIGGAFELKALLEQALDACCEALHFERGLIALKTARGEPEMPVTRNVQRDETGAYKISRSLINRALIHGERAVVNNPAIDLVSNLSESLVRFPISSALCVPILHRDQILGVIYGDRLTQADTYTAEDVDFLAAIARQVGVGLENLRLFQAHLETEKLKEELRRARAIQRGLLPDAPLQTGTIHLSGHNEPSEAVGGDYFDYFEIGDGRVGLTIADVTGHGLPAAMLMANLQAAVRVLLTSDIPLADVATRLNALACRNMASSVFITAIVGRVNVTSGELEYINAGHPPPLLLDPGSARQDDAGQSLPFGVDVHERFWVRRITAPEARAVVFYTDGLIEAPDPAGQLLGVDAVLSTLRALPTRGPDLIIPALLNRVRLHLAGAKNGDDLTLLSLCKTR